MVVEELPSLTRTASDLASSCHSLQVPFGAFHRSDTLNDGVVVPLDFHNMHVWRHRQIL